MEQKDKTIFISIAAYNEFFLEQTVRNCISMAKYPERLNFGIWSLNSDGVVPSFSDLKNVKIITAQHPIHLGVCTSRIGAIFLYSQEDYFLQIDAHMLFQKNWDEILIKSYENIKIKENHNKVIITTRPHWWADDEKGNILHYDPNALVKAPILDYAKDNHKDFLIPMTTSYDPNWKDEEYYEHYGFSAHFAFSSKEFIYEILPDIQIMFMGEEETTAIRSWTRGYRMFSIPDNTVWHYNKYQNQKISKVLYKYDRNIYSPYHLQQDFAIKQEKGYDRIRKIQTGEITGYWGAPTIEDLERYQKAAGFDFKDFYKKRDEWEKKK